MEGPPSILCVAAKPRLVAWAEPLCCLLLMCMMHVCCPMSCGGAGLFISEVLFNPPTNDRENEYIELRGTPNAIVPRGTCLLVLEGDSESNPGTLKNAFDLSCRRIGGNGFLVLLQKGSSYTASEGAASLRNSVADGWGSGSGSSIGQLGDGNLVEVDNASVTFLLVKSETWIAPGQDLDTNDDGVIDSTFSGRWQVLDGVGILDNDGPGDMAYGKVNFRRANLPGSSATAFGRVISVNFTPTYVARRGNGTEFTESNWAAGRDLRGTAPHWSLGAAASCWPTGLAGSPLDHIGAPNFGAPELPGIIALTSEEVILDENGGVAQFAVFLNTKPAGLVTLELTASSRLELSLDGQNFSHTATVKLRDRTPTSVCARAIRNDAINPTKAEVTTRVVSSADSAHYPLSMETPQVIFTIAEDSFILLSELKINPPGSTDAPYEFIELAGTPGAELSGVRLLVLDSDGIPGTVVYQANLDGIKVGSNGLVLLTATNTPYNYSPQTTVFSDHLFSSGGVLPNSGASVLLVSTSGDFEVGMDLDANDDGRLETLSPDTLIVDSLGWSGSARDLNYASARIVSSAAPDAAGRRPSSRTANSVSNWFYGDLQDGAGDTLTFDQSKTGPDFPAGAFLTPGAPTRFGPTLETLRAISGVIGDTNNPEVPVAMSGSTNTAGDWRWVVTSTNQTVLPNDKITVLLCEHGALVKLAPVGVGYSELSITVSDGVISNSVLVQYAASSSSRAATAWHLAASDGSTAILLDGDVMLIGDDENQGIRLYPRSRSSLPLKQYDFTSNLELPDLGAGMPREVDIEASTRVANRIFWIGSHGHSSFGEIRTNRTRIFATDLHETGDSTTLSYVGRYDYLKFDLLRWDSLNLHRKGTNFYGIEASDAEGVPPKAPDGSGFAIEGLAFSTTDTNTAWVGFRAPIVPPGRRTRTLLVPVTNFYDLVSTGGPPGSSEFGDPVVLDLGGRGIRSIEGNGGGYLIVAGPPGVGASDLPEDFKIFTWSGDAEHAAVERTADLRGLNPEGIIALPPAPWTERSVVGLLSDCGTVEYYGDGLSAKLLSTKNFKKCRSDWLEIGGVVSAYYLTTTIAVGQGVVHVEWRAQPGLTYVVEICDSLAALEWRPAIGPIVADRQLGRVELAIEGRQRFVRVRRVE